ncbi:ATP-binding protein [Leptolyngbya sp. AN02str]|uniref:ATP-binding protein n=1 Tax=Leptolyngbya sp. AN02str TaxID=3423363 RepID=UPI003D31A838
MPPDATPPLDELLPALHLLDGLLERSMQLTETLHSSKRTTQDIQNTDHIRQIELALPPGYPRYSPARSNDLPSSQVKPSSRLGMLQHQLSLTAFELDIILIALAPELDRRYEQIYAYLQQDGRGIRPSVNLVLNLLCADAAEKLQRRSHFAPSAPLRHHALLHLSPPQPSNHTTLLAQEVNLDPAIARYLLDETGLDADLSPFCSLIQTPLPPPQTNLPAALLQQIEIILKQEQGAIANAASSAHTIRLYLQSADPVLPHQFVQALAHHLDRPLLTVDLESLAQQPDQLPQRLRRLRRDAWLQNTLLYLHPVGSLYQDSTPTFYPLLTNLLAETYGPIILSGRQPWQPSSDRSLGIVTISLPPLSFGDRCACWTTHLATAKLTVEPTTIAALADRFRLTSTQIQDAIATTQNQLKYGLELASIEALLFKAVRSQSANQLTKLAQPIQPRYTWQDLVLPDAQLAQLRDICAHLQHRHQVFDTWGFERKLSLGKGINALFAGPPGTGKTMAAEVIAHALGLDLYKIDLSQVVSKYIGETEKSLNRIFTAAGTANAVLLFDEADALFGKRTEVKDAHDRYANIETSYLLQKMEEYEGIAILTTNLQSNMDDAFVRRLRFIVEFPMPGVEERRRIWQQIWPASLPLDKDVNLDFLAENLDIAGAVIRNIALQAAYLAAAANKQVSMAQVIPAVRLEYQKMGKILMRDDLKEYGDLR